MASANSELTISRLNGWLDRWHALRDRLLASRVFQRRAASFVLTRPIARRHARELFDLVAGFVYSQVLLACVQLRVFEIVADSPQSADWLAARLDLPIDSARRLLDAAVSLRLLERRSEGRYGLGELGAPMVGNAAVAEMVKHHAALYADLADPVALLRASAQSRRASSLARYWPYAEAAAGNEEVDGSVSEYCALMSASQPLVADEILDAYSLRGHSCLMDVGGGDGTFMAAVSKRAPALRLMLFDLPAVAERARMRFASSGLAHRATAFGGSFLNDALPTGADIATLVRVIHDHNDADAMCILRSVRRALPADGTLLLAEPMAGTRGAQAMGDAYFGFYLLAMGTGRPRTVGELSRMLNEAGFRSVKQLQTHVPLQTTVLIARCAGVNPDAVCVTHN